ncbi:hypothetical protein [Mesorhizobium sp. M00.F.Ca.ET.217.01.1.1]|uniref:hypothetical protein n=1 Tax=Mesorhizobium sp. M00.F.Ca.ET.217.01.1.1 TaxID=2500529 RepID=UPI000FD9802E|nr:hypothetical protein [Mesorhizobium sp. M00.F.Ca.ET.217.01.1.1]TGQ19353.1 hypothetical protein EN860_019695 [Mesorhizobium sp. M00.F.Ca.ET.217.01.1.1]
MNLARHADASGDIRRAADCAAGMAVALRKLNDGPVFDHDRDRLIKDVDAYFGTVAKTLGYKLEAA